MIKLDDFKNLNPKNPGAWPWMVKLVVFIALFAGVVAAGALLDWQDQWESLGQVREEEEKLKEAFLAKKQQAINLDLIRKQLTATQESFGALLKQLPSKSEMDALLADITQGGLGGGVRPPMDATAKTFRYLDEEEIAAQKKAAAPAKGKGK